MSTLTAVNIAKFTATVLRSILNRLQHQHIFPPAEYGPRTMVLNYFLPAPLDVNNELPEDELEKAADDLILQLREGSYETFVELPLPIATEYSAKTRDANSGLCVRFVRTFDPMKMMFVTVFSIGVQAN